MFALNRHHRLAHPAPEHGWRPSDRARASAGYWWGVLGIAACAGSSAVVARYLQLSDLVMINLLPVIGVATVFGIGPSLVTAALSALCFDFFFIPPAFALTPANLKHSITVGVMVIVAGVVNGLAEIARRQRTATRTRELALQRERLRNSLLAAISRDLRIPLAAISGAGTELLRDEGRLTSNERGELAETIIEEVARLEQLVTNLLDVTELDEGALRIRKRPEPLDEVVEAALGRVRARFGTRPVRSRIPEAIPMVPMDAVLIQQVLVNLLEHALAYTRDGAPVEVEATQGEDEVVVEVRDGGRRVHVPEFVALSTPGGAAELGLSICNAIVHAHGGTVALRTRETGAVLARLTLPLAEMPVV